MQRGDAERRRRRRPTPVPGTNGSQAPDISAYDDALPQAQPAATQPPPIPQPTAQPTAQSTAQPGAEPARPPRRRRAPRSDGAEQSLRDIVGAGSSQLGVSGALRGRDVARPTDADVAEALANVRIVRRNWTAPPDAHR